MEFHILRLLKKKKGKMSRDINIVFLNIYILTPKCNGLDSLNRLNDMKLYDKYYYNKQIDLMNQL